MTTVARSRPQATAPAFDVDAIRREFPILAQRRNGKPLVFLDSAASAQKPRAVLEAIDDCYERYYANVHRGVHWLSQQSTEAFEEARETARRFLGAPDVCEIVFVRGTTEAINLVQSSWGRRNVSAGDEVMISELEHHSNLVPWQALCEERGAKLVVAPIDDRGEIVLEELERRLTARTRLVAVAHVSNSLGTINPVREIVELAHAAGALVLVDGAQAAPHLPIDVQALGCDFYAFSGHKAFGPTGIGVLWGRKALLDAMPPYQYGGEMIRTVTFEKTEWAPVPHKFEAGTPDIAGAVGLSAALRWIESHDRDAVHAHEAALLAETTRLFAAQPDVRILGTARHKTALVSFVMDGVHAHDLGTILDEEGIAVRTGHHCAQPVMKKFGVAASARASFALYNTLDEVAALSSALDRVREIFSSMSPLSDDLRQLYQEVILDHYKRPRNFGPLPHADHSAEGYNPLCGDQVKVSVRLEDGRVADAHFEGAGCAISTASASLMTEAVKGMTIDEAEALFQRFHGLVSGKSSAAADGEDLGKLEALAGVRDYPVRIKCATLAWHALRSALHGGDKVTTE